MKYKISSIIIMLFAVTLSAQVSNSAKVLTLVSEHQGPVIGTTHPDF